MTFVLQIQHSDNIFSSQVLAYSLCAILNILWNHPELLEQDKIRGSLASSF